MAETIAYYKHNASTLLTVSARSGSEAYGGTDSPYIWLRTPDGMTSWGFSTCCLECCRGGHSGLRIRPVGRGLSASDSVCHP